MTKHKNVFGQTEDGWKVQERKATETKLEQERHWLNGRDPEEIYYTHPRPAVGEMKIFYCRSSQCAPRSARPRRVETIVERVEVSDSYPHGNNRRYRSENHTLYGTCPHCGGAVKAQFSYDTNYSEFVIIAPARPLSPLDLMDAVALGMDED